MAASSAPTAPKKPDSIAIRRSGIIDASTWSVIVVTLATVTVGTMSRMARRTAPATASGRTFVRSENCCRTPGSWNAFEVDHPPYRLLQVQVFGVADDADDLVRLIPRGSRLSCRSKVNSCPIGLRSPK